MCGEVNHGRSDAADIDYIDAGLLYTTCERRGELGTGQPPVVADRNSGLVASPRFRTDRVAYRRDNFGRQSLAHYATNIIGLENLLRYRGHVCSELVGAKRRTGPRNI